MAKDTPKDEYISARIPSGLKRALEAKASEDKRSVSNVLELLVEGYVGWRAKAAMRAEGARK